MKLPKLRWLGLVSIVVVLAVPVAVLVSYWPALFPPPPDEDETGGASAADNRQISTPFMAAGIRMPFATKAHESDFSDDEPIIGVSTRGRHRAYRVGSMTQPSTHVINDLLDDCPVTVTYCNSTDCVKVFTSSKKGEPLNVDLGGFHNGLMLRVDGRFFSQATNTVNGTGEPALEEMAHTRTTWGKWRGLYPDTDAIARLGNTDPRRRTKAASGPP